MWTQFPTPMFLNTPKHNYRVYGVVFKYTASMKQIENTPSLHQPKLKAKENDLGPNPLETEPHSLVPGLPTHEPQFPMPAKLKT